MSASTAFLTLAPLFQAATQPAPLPADPPIGGPVWTIVIPAVLFLGSFLATYLLYKKFSKVEVGE
jgi:hypothetical protein